ncbi:F-box protein SKIP23-like [Phoenix dactylifera]|uniref:F-box protein SKIP23-like n=1 Tax=Phoenix dactylifera TaxID=42345 RepID=A0A8B7MSX3_PHODC|nr:F-box protein SKIP23-like [Phoenix dactylifera]
MAQWTMVPADVLQTIADFLARDIRDFIRFRAVCESWRSATTELRSMPSLPPQLPWLMLSFDEAFTNTRSFYRLSDRTILNFHLPEVGGKRIVGSAVGWLVLVSAASAICLFDPLTRAQVHLPPLTTLPQVLEFREQEVGAEYVIEEAQEDQQEEEDEEEEAGGAYLLGSDHVKDLLVFARPGDGKWTMSDRRFICTDILWHQGQLYAVDNGGVVAVCELSPTFKLTPITAEVPIDFLWCFLVELCGDLLVVFRYPEHGWDPFPWTAYPTRGFEVFKLDRSSKEARLVEVKSLGDHMLFLGTNNSFSLSTKDFPGWKGNCIYFTASYFEICGFIKPE